MLLNPREYCDHLGAMICFHARYNLGDKHDYLNPDYAIIEICKLDTDPEHLALEAQRRGYESRSDFLDNADVIWLPLYLYDHSGITMRTTPFSCQWDSGQVGFVYCTWEGARKEFSTHTDERIKTLVHDLFRSEVEEYDRYLRGEEDEDELEDA